jgi:hypothetical protein
MTWMAVRWLNPEAGVEKVWAWLSSFCERLAWIRLVGRTRSNLVWWLSIRSTASL